jgi:hypothetical protein
LGQEAGNAYYILVVKSLGKRPLQTGPRHRWEENNGKHSKEVGCEDVKCI